VRYFAVASLKRGAIDPPEELPAAVQDAIWRAEFMASQRKPPEPEVCIELRWMRDGKEFREMERRKRRTA
jgi:hypothetical protein